MHTEVDTQFDIASMTLKRSVNDNGFHLMSKRTKWGFFLFYVFYELLSKH